MSVYWITFRSLTHAQRAARLLERKGLTATVVRVPQGMSEHGCAYAVTLRGRPEEAMKLLRLNGLRPGKLFERETDGGWTEVRV